MPIAPDDPRLQQCGFAKLVDEANDLVYVMRKYEIVLGRQSKSAGTDVVLGQDNMNVSRAHATIRWNFESRCFELLVMGKNGVTVRGALVTPASAPFPLRSQDVLQLGAFNLTFLLPKAPPHAAAEHRPPPMAQQAQQAWNNGQAAHQLGGWRRAWGCRCGLLLLLHARRARPRPLRPAPSARARATP
jgi:hypothetical protein